MNLASIVPTAAGGLFNAFVFAGAGHLFQKINKDGYGEETKRHDLAMEQLEKARQEWNQKDVERLEKAANLRQERSDADADFEKTNKSLKDYEKVTTLVFGGKKIYARTTYLGFLRSVRRDERIHDISYRNNGIGWWMDGWENYL